MSVRNGQGCIGGCPICAIALGIQAARGKGKAVALGSDSLRLVFAAVVHEQALCTRCIGGPILQAVAGGTAPCQGARWNACKEHLNRSCCLIWRLKQDTIRSGRVIITASYN